MPDCEHTSWFDRPVQSEVEGLTTNGGKIVALRNYSGSSIFPFVVSLSNHERAVDSPFDKLRVNGFLGYLIDYSGKSSRCATIYQQISPRILIKQLPLFIEGLRENAQLSD